MPVPHRDATRRRRLRLLVLGIGNLLFSDDGVGVHAVRMLKKRPRASVLVTEIGTAMLDAVPLLAWADRVLVVDAMQAGGRSGTIYWGRLSAMESRVLGRSIHDMDLSAVLGLIPRSSSQPEVFVLGIEPERLELGLELTSSLQVVLPQLTAIIENILSGWRAENAPCQSGLPKLLGQRTTAVARDTE